MRISVLLPCNVMRTSVCRDLETFVETLKTDSSSGVSQRSLTLKEVEVGAVGLRKVGENLTGLKGTTTYQCCFIHL